MYGMCWCPVTTNRWALDRSSAGAKECANSVESLWAERCRQQQTLFNPSVVNRDVEFSASLDAIQQLSLRLRPEETTQLVELIELVAVLAATMLSLIILWAIIRNWVTSSYPKSHPPRRIPALDVFQCGQGARDIVDAFDDVDYDADDSDSSSEAEILFTITDPTNLHYEAILTLSCDGTIEIGKNQEESSRSQVTGDALADRRNSIHTEIDQADQQSGVLFDFLPSEAVDIEKNPKESTKLQETGDVSDLSESVIPIAIDPFKSQYSVVPAIPFGGTTEIQNSEKVTRSQEICDVSDFSSNTDFNKNGSDDSLCGIVLATPIDKTIETVQNIEIVARSQEIDSSIIQNAEETRPEITQTTDGRQNDEENLIVTREDSRRNSRSDLLDVSVHCDVDSDEFNQEETTVNSGIPSAAAFSHPEMFLRCPTPDQGDRNGSCNSSSGRLPDILCNSFAHLYESVVVVEEIPHLNYAVVHTVVVLESHLEVDDAESEGSFHSIQSSNCDWFTASSDDEIISDSYLAEKNLKM